MKICATCIKGRRRAKTELLTDEEVAEWIDNDAEIFFNWGKLFVSAANSLGIQNFVALLKEQKLILAYGTWQPSRG